MLYLMLLRITICANDFLVKWYMLPENQNIYDNKPESLLNLNGHSLINYFFAVTMPYGYKYEKTLSYIIRSSSHMVMKLSFTLYVLFTAVCDQANLFVYL